MQVSAWIMEVRMLIPEYKEEEEEKQRAIEEEKQKQKEAAIQAAKDAIAARNAQKIVDPWADGNKSNESPTRLRREREGLSRSPYKSESPTKEAENEK